MLHGSCVSASRKYFKHAKWETEQRNSVLQQQFVFTLRGAMSRRLPTIHVDARLSRHDPTEFTGRASPHLLPKMCERGGQIGRESGWVPWGAQWKSLIHSLPHSLHERCPEADVQISYLHFCVNGRSHPGCYNDSEAGTKVLFRILELASRYARSGLPTAKTPVQSSKRVRSAEYFVNIFFSKLLE